MGKFNTAQDVPGIGKARPLDRDRSESLRPLISFLFYLLQVSDLGFPFLLQGSL